MRMLELTESDNEYLSSSGAVMWLPPRTVVFLHMHTRSWVTMKDAV